MAVRQGAGDGEGIAVRGDDGAAFQYAAQALVLAAVKMRA